MATETTRDVPTSELQDLVDDYELEGWTVKKVDQNDGFWTVIAKSPQKKKPKPAPNNPDPVIDPPTSGPDPVIHPPTNEPDPTTPPQKPAPKPKPPKLGDSPFVGAAKKLTSLDIIEVGDIIGVGEDEIHAVMDVEAAGSGFDKKGRPRMLFEPHIFYRQLKGAERAKAVNLGLAYQTWKRKYPKDSYPRLKKAIKINRTAALKSASWGLGQVMGFNHELAGYTTVETMVVNFMADEENQLKGMIMFIKNNNLDDELRDHNWAGFARGYNGSGYRKNNYHIKLAKAFAKWQKIKDTPRP